jgi:hypothetical protein
LWELRKVTIENKPLCNSKLSLVKITEKLEEVLQRVELEEVLGREEDIEQIWSWFLSLLDQARLIPQLADSFDFGYASSPG